MLIDYLEVFADQHPPFPVILELLAVVREAYVSVVQVRQRVGDRRTKGNTLHDDKDGWMEGEVVK